MGKTEQKENSHLWFSECRKVTTHKCPSINVNGNRISVSAIMKKLKNFCHFINIDHKEKFKLLVPSKFGCLVFKVSTFKTFMHGNLSALRKPEMQIFR